MSLKTYQTAWISFTITAITTEEPGWHCQNYQMGSKPCHRHCRPYRTGYYQGCCFDLTSLDFTTAATATTATSCPSYHRRNLLQNLATLFQIDFISIVSFTSGYTATASIVTNRIPYRMDFEPEMRPYQHLQTFLGRPFIQYECQTDYSFDFYTYLADSEYYLT